MKRSIIFLFIGLLVSTWRVAAETVTVNTSQGSFDIVMLDADAPLSVANFLNYVNRGAFDGTFIHRSVPGFIVQGGGFAFDPVTGTASHIPTDPAVVNEFKISNTRGTVAMAKVGNDPNSATSEWFVNLADNAANLDNQNGGFTVFGTVDDAGMAVVDAIAALPTSSLNIAGSNGALTDTPTVNFTGTVTESIFVTLTSVTSGTTDPSVPSPPVEPDEPPAARLGNIASRGSVRLDEEVLIGGLIIGGSTTKQVVVRARGPSMTQMGVTDVLADPQLQLFSGTSLLAENDNWQDYSLADQIPANLMPTESREAAILIKLAPGPYTAIVSGVGRTQGVGLVEIFEVADTGVTRLINIATRGFVGTGDDVLIGGVIIGGTESKTLTFRALGPSMEALGVVGALADPVLQLLDVNGTLIATNDNWQDDENVSVLRADLQPTDTREAVLTRTLTPGNYTAIVRGANSAVGVGIIEVFDLD
jgi:cyclophilin family peptidyl-prolyl cis-trans isomerase